MLSLWQSLHQIGKLLADVSGLARCCVGLPQRGQMIFPSSVTIVACFSVTCNFFALLLLLISEDNYGFKPELRGIAVRFSRGRTYRSGTGLRGLGR